MYEDPSDAGCFVCAIWPLVRYGEFMGYLPVTYSCPHHKPNGKTGPKVSYCFIRLFSTFLYFSYDLIISTINLWPLDLRNSAVFLVFELQKIIELICGVAGRLFNLQSILYFEQLADNTAAFTERAQSLGFQLLTKRQERQIFYWNGQYFGIVALYGALIVCKLTDSWHAEDFLARLLTEILLMASMLSMSLVSVYATLMVGVYGTFVESVHAKTRNVLDQLQLPRPDPAAIPRIRSDDEIIDVEDRNWRSPTDHIKQLRRLYMAIVVEFIDFNQSCDPGLALVTVFSGIYAIGMCYIFIVTFWDQLEFKYAFIAAGKGIIIIVVGSVVSTLKSNCLHVPNERMLEYLSHYPLTGLCQELVYELEMYLMNMADICPHFSASHIVTINSELIVPAATAVVSFAVIALQFKFADELEDS